MTNEEQQEAFRQFQQAQMEAHHEAMRAQRLAVEHQHEMNVYPRQQYAAIVAVDDHGGFSKDGKIPWKYSADFKWFKERTMNQICVMGRKTYDDLCEIMGEKGKESILPGRKCFVVTSTELPVANATAVPNIGAVDKLLTDEDFSKTVFFIGGEQIYREGIAKCQTVYVTIVNKHVDADRFFPVKYLMKQFTLSKVFSVDEEPDLRFTTWVRTK